VTVTAPWPLASMVALESGLPLLLTQLSETVRRTSTPSSQHDIGGPEGHDGSPLPALGFSLSQLIHAYGDICQAVTELAFELKEPIAFEEFQTMDRCLDDAIAEALTEHARAPG
jgi:hypothetical protein